MSRAIVDTGHSQQSPRKSFCVRGWLYTARDLPSPPNLPACLLYLPSPKVSEVGAKTKQALGFYYVEGGNPFFLNADQQGIPTHHSMFYLKNVFKSYKGLKFY